MKTVLTLLFATALSLVGLQTTQAETFDAVRRADNTRVVPEKFLRDWDPITIFFDYDDGPAKGGPADAHEKFATITPEPPGEWRWLGPRALQFRPAEPWRPLQRVTVKSPGQDTRLVALLPPPSATIPAAGADPSPELTQIALTFPSPVDATALAKALSVEVRASPGISPDGQAQTPKDYDILPLERGARADSQSYVVKFKRVIGDGRVAVLRLALADEPGLSEQTFELRALTATPFVAVEAACGRGWSDDKIGDVLRCASNATVATTTTESGDEEGTEPRQTYTPADKRRISLSFSAEPGELDILKARNALRFTPPVDDLSVEVERKRLKISGKFLSEQIYALNVASGALNDARGRPLAAPYVLRFAFTRDAPTLRWDAGRGIVERFGPQLLPARGRGYERADIRIHAIDPFARDFWPFPENGVETQDAAAPPLPGEEPKHWSETADIEADAINQRIKALGSPAVSRLVDLPLRRNGGDAKFGLDLREDFARIAGPEQPGAYLVGLRAADETSRRWVRVTVTDLSLSVVEEPQAVRFVVTSLASAQPVAGAQIRVEGVRDDKFITLTQGTTDASGFFVWKLAKRAEAELRRVVVQKGADTLTVDPDSAPSEYAKENWSKPDAAWLAWTTDPQAQRDDKPRTLCHLYTERPIYRPEEPVHIKGYVRLWRGGALILPKAGGTLVVSGPNNQEWRIPVKPDAAGGFYHKFDAQTMATGDYAIKYEPTIAKPKPKEKGGEGDKAKEPPKEREGGAEATAPDQQAGESEEAEDAAPEDVSCGSFPFKKEAYRLPTFEVVLNAPQTVPLDGEFSVDLLARYFAGGLAAERPVKWRAAQFAHVFAPPGRDGFLFSTDARFSGEGKFKSTAVLERDQRTDAGGAARMSFDTTIEPTAQPRRYSIEATVTGEDGVEVRNVQNVIALPPFVLGVKTPRYVEKPGVVAPELIAVNGKGEALEGLNMTLRLIKRNWMSTLQASDFAQGAAKYVTQVEEQTLIERKIVSVKDAQKIELQAVSAGVYVVQLEAYDRIGRRQQVSVDFFVGGDTPVSFQRAPSSTATVTLDKEKYAPGETATLLIQSPFQNARALAIVEQPSGVYDYRFVDIANGFGRFPLTIKKEQAPKVAVHFLIMRGRLKDSNPKESASFDQGKPVTVAATKWVDVTPVKNTIAVKIDAPAKARPGQEVEVTLRLADDAGKPLAGEATFWMVDQAVLSLAKEQPLDPLANFILARDTKLAARDTRNMAFGVIPLEEIAGGDGAALEEWGAENNISVRKNFTPVPIYLPSVKIGADGVAKIKLRLPDTLTVFKLRAKAVSGSDRFGSAGAEMLIRQELVAQPALPRFVRSGDRLDLGLVARVIEGPGGSGSASIVAKGLTLQGAGTQKIEWAQNKPVRIDIAASVPEPKEGVASAKLGFRIERDADRAKDAVEVDLPLKPDRTPQRKYEIVEIAPGESKTLPAVAEGLRPESFARKIVFAGDPSLVKVVAGVNAIVENPCGCIVQRISLARAALALKAVAPLLEPSALDGRVSEIVKATAQAIDQSVDGDGLVAFWPRGAGNVTLTAWAYAFLAEAQHAGELVDQPLLDRLANALRNSLRSDFPRLLAGDELRERVEALTALAEGGKLDEAYVAEFARRADFLPNVSVALMTSAVARRGGEAERGVDKRVVTTLLDTLWARVKFLQRGGAQVYGGQTADGGSPLILPSEALSLAEMTRATTYAAPDDARTRVLRDALLRLGEGDGWGAVNADAAAIRALAESWRRPPAPIVFSVSEGSEAPKTLTLDANAPAIRWRSERNAAIALANTSNAPLVALVETSYEPSEPGAKALSVSEGFALTRALWRVKSGEAPMERLERGENGAVLLQAGDIIEETAELVNPSDRTHVSIALPLPAGFEPLNPNLATSPREAQPSAAPTLAPSYVSYGDDRVFYAYDFLPKGNYRFAFRVKAQTAGSFTQPSGVAQTIYRKGIYGASAGERIEIGK